MFKLSNHCFDQILFIVGPVINSRWTMPMDLLATTVLAMLPGGSWSQFPGRVGRDAMQNRPGVWESFMEEGI